MRILIIGNGNIENNIIHNILNPSDIVICCDGGSKYLFEEGILPHYIIGDLDSSKPEIIQFFETKKVIFKKFDAKKDETDMELCIDFAIGLTPDEIIILGGIGTRFDHSLANVNLLIKSEDENIKTTIIDSKNTINITKNEFQIEGKKGDLVSLLPISSVVSGVTTKGLEYPLNNATMHIGKALGISNVMLEDFASVSVKNGYLLVIKSID